MTTTSGVDPATTSEDGTGGPAGEPTPRRRSLHLRATSTITVLTIGLVVAVVVAAGIGAFPVSPGEILSSLTHKVGLGIGPVPDPTVDGVLWQVRFPRVVMAIIVGVSLGVAGALMQGVFSNPLAEPGIVGVSAGAAAGAAIVIVSGLALGAVAVPAAAFVGGILTAFLVYVLSRADGKTEVVTLVLTGIAVNAFMGAVIGLMSYLSNDEQLRSLLNWTLGSLGSASWRDVALTAPLAVLGVLLAPLFAAKLDLLSLGESQARHLGVDVERLRIAVIAVVAVLTAAAVATAGIITFVGLVVPHLVRMIAGPGHRIVLLGSAILGALVMVVSDLVARTVVAPAELPLGVLTALVGSPVFFVLLRRTRKQQGGWA